MLKNRDRLTEATVLYAINLDNAFLALFVRLACFFRRVPLVVEIADIQPVMTGDGIISRSLRFLERFILRRSQLLITTSPPAFFLRCYFEPVHSGSGRTVGEQGISFRCACRRQKASHWAG